jgi:hypothetical protein
MNLVRPNAAIGGFGGGLEGLELFRLEDRRRSSASGIFSDRQQYSRWGSIAMQQQSNFPMH